MAFFFRPRGLGGPFAAMVPDSRIAKAKSASVVDSTSPGIPCTYVSLDWTKKKREKFRIRQVQSGSSCAGLDLGFEKGSAWGAYEKRIDTPLGPGFHVPLHDVAMIGLFRGAEILLIIKKKEK